MIHLDKQERMRLFFLFLNNNNKEDKKNNVNDCMSLD
jgi:hypothetical protein